MLAPLGKTATFTTTCNKPCRPLISSPSAPKLQGVLNIQHRTKQRTPSAVQRISEADRQHHSTADASRLLTAQTCNLPTAEAANTSGRRAAARCLVCHSECLLPHFSPQVAPLVLDPPWGSHNSPLSTIVSGDLIQPWMQPQGARFPCCEPQLPPRSTRLEPEVSLSPYAGVSRSSWKIKLKDKFISGAKTTP